MNEWDAQAAPAAGEDRPDEPRTDEELHRFIRMSHIFSSVVREILETRLLQESTTLPLTLSQFHMLKLMTVSGTHQIGELAEFLGVSAPAVTKNVDKLERLGLLVRMHSEGDRRAILLAPSPKGRRLVETYEGMKAARLYPVLAEFPAAELTGFADMLERVSVALLRREETPRGFCLRCAAYIETGCPVGHVRGGCPYDRLEGEETTVGDKK